MSDPKRIERAAKKLQQLIDGNWDARIWHKDSAASLILTAADAPEPEVAREVTQAGLLSYYDSPGSGMQEYAEAHRAMARAFLAMKAAEGIPPFTEKMREAMYEVWAEAPAALRPMYEAARKLEGK